MDDRWGATAPLWDQNPRAKRVPTRSDIHPFADRSWDSVVVGGGLAGVMTALRLTERGATVLLLEAGRIAGRTTGHSTAKVSALQGALYRQLIAGKGIDTAAVYARESLHAVQSIAALADEFGIACDMTRATAITCAREDRRIPEEEFEAATACGLPVRWIDPTEMEQFPLAVAGGAVALDDQLGIDPVRLCLGLVAQLETLGAQVCEGVRVTSVEEDEHGCVVRGDDWSVSADSAVLATHLPIVDPGLLAGRTKPMRSYAVAGIPGIPAPSGMYLAADAGWSYRPVGSGARPVVIVGGEGHPLLDGVESGPGLERLTKRAEAIFEMETSHRWSAFDYHSVDGLPFIGRLAPGCDRRFVATGFGKWGMTTSAIAADVIADLVDGRTHPAAEALDASRVVATIGRDLVKNNVKVAKRFVGARALASADASADPAPGTGTVIRHGASFVARACDANGTVYSLDAACTHLGCIVEFNAGEQTWDCPCHGSRFDIDGSVLDGPASAPLSPT
jgi:glycine/D-amino acid oxidase-like deaminating enzyme/nitrite reductase/ring-hydroxylating ferredoxin subunit